MQSRVGELDLHVRTSSGRADVVAAAARAFACRVLERCDALLEQRAPGRLVFIRELQMEWRVWEDALDVADEVDAVAEELVRAFEANAVTNGAAETALGEVAVFSDEAKYRAEYIRAVAEHRAEQCWYFQPLGGDAAAPHAIDSIERRRVIKSALATLHADGALEQTLTALPRSILTTIARALEVGDASDPEAMVPDLRSSVVAAVVRQLASLRSPALLFVAADADAERPWMDGTGHSRATRGERHASADTAAEVSSETVTQFGGLFYLLGLALELGLGELLWQACLPEPAVFAHIAGIMLGAEARGDPAPRLFAGDSDLTLSPFTEEQNAEVASGLLAATIEALGRRPAIALPAVWLDIVSHRGARLLVARPPRLPFVLFARPSDSRQALADFITEFLALWPASGPRPTANPALAPLDRSGRLQPARPALSPSLFLADCDDLAAAALLSQVAGSLASLFAIRASADIASQRQLVERYFRIPARVAISAEEMTVSMPMDRIDLEVRRAGLDRDPGWVPWMLKRVRFAFVGDTASV